MSADSSIQLDSLNDVRSALGSVRGLCGEYVDFFSGVFSRLESASEAVEAREQSRERQLAELQRQQQLWEQERTILERELEAVRNRAAELSEELAQQKRDADAQQAQWSRELKSMRRALQQMSHRLTERVEEPSAPVTAAPPEAPRARPAKTTGAADPVLNSVMAQFELLQSDAARRRGPSKE